MLDFTDTYHRGSSAERNLQRTPSSIFCTSMQFYGYRSPGVQSCYAFSIQRPLLVFGFEKSVDGDLRSQHVFCTRPGKRFGYPLYALCRYILRFVCALLERCWCRGIAGTHLMSLNLSYSRFSPCLTCTSIQIAQHQLSSLSEIVRSCDSGDGLFHIRRPN